MQSGTLPDSLQTQLQQYRTQCGQTEAKDLHRLVKSRTDAKQELNRLEQERAAYEQAWLAYVDQLSELFLKQVQEREDYQREVQEAMDQWTQRAKTASAALTTAAADGSLQAEQALQDDAPSDMVVDAAKVAADVAADVRSRAEEQTKSLTAVFRGAQKRAQEANVWTANAPRESAARTALRSCSQTTISRTKRSQLVKPPLCRPLPKPGAEPPGTRRAHTSEVVARHWSPTFIKES